MANKIANFIFTSVGTHGDVMPFIRMARLLSAQGHRVSVITHGVYQTVMEFPGAFRAIDRDSDFRQFVDDGYLLDSPQGWSEFIRRHVLSRLSVECQEILCCASSNRPVVIVSRSMPFIAAKAAAELLDVPIIPVLLSPAHYFGLPIYQKLLKGCFLSEINQFRRSVGLRPVSDVSDWWDTDGYMGLWPTWFAEPGTFLPDRIFLAGFPVEWRNEQPATFFRPETPFSSCTRPVLITGGTGLFAGPTFFKSAVIACHSLGAPATIVCRRSEMIPDELPENIVHVREVPSLFNLMVESSVVLHHGGMGTAAEACAAGIPQLILPTGGDRVFNAHRLAELKLAAVADPHAPPHTLARHLKSLMTASDIKEQCAKIARRVRAERFDINSHPVIESFNSF